MLFHAISFHQTPSLRKLRVSCNMSPVEFPYSVILFHSHSGYGCDTCGLEPLQSKLTCLTCIDDNWRMTMDFCIKCTDTVPEHRIYKHDLSHLLLKTDHLIPDRHLPWMIPTARIVGERVKSLFRSRNAECVCCCCNSRVSLPCYVCVKCSTWTTLFYLIQFLTRKL